MAREVQLERYYPSVVAPAREFRYLAKAENPEFNVIHKLFEKWFLNGFVMKLDADGAERWEDMLNLTPKISDTIEDRRRRILSKINSLLPYTHRRLANMLDDRYGVGKTELDFRYNEYLLNVNIDRTLVPEIRALFFFLRAIVPANLAIMLRYTSNIDGVAYFGAVVRQRKHIKIAAAAGFSLDEVPLNPTFGAIIRQYKRQKIKAGE